MSRLSGTAALIAEHLRDCDAQWSLGTFGGIVEFSRDSDEPAQLDLGANRLSVATGRSGIRLEPSAELRPLEADGAVRSRRTEWP